MSRSNSNGPRPEDFPVGSPESRAAARRLILLRDRPDIVIVNHTARPRRPQVTTRSRTRQPDGRIIEIVNLSDADAEKLA